MRFGETFDAVVFDWDAIGVTDQSACASSVRQRLEALSAAGVHVFLVSDTDLRSIDDQLRARPSGSGRLFLCLSHGSEFFEVGADFPVLVRRRSASNEEDTALDRAAELVVSELLSKGLGSEVVSGQVNRRKIDLIPLPQWADPPKARIGELAEALKARLSSAGVEDLGEVVELATRAAHKSGLSNPRITCDVKHVEIGLTDQSDSARFAATWLAERGITGALILIVGNEFGAIDGARGGDSLMLVEELSRARVVSVGARSSARPAGVVHFGGGLSRLWGLLDEQLERRVERRVPGVDLDPRWVLALPTARSRERASEALATLQTLGDSWAGTRASREEDGSSASPMFVVGGIYTPDNNGLLPGPIWTVLDVRHPTGTQPTEHRILDLHTATLLRFSKDGYVRRSMRFVSGASSYAMALRAEGPAGCLGQGEVLAQPPDASGFEYSKHGGAHVVRSGRPPGGGIAVAARDRVCAAEGRSTIERLAAWVADANKVPSFDQALERLSEIESTGFDALLAEHREAWARRWRDAEVVIEGSPRDELAARFSVFHLLSTAADVEEAAVGARGLSGSAYGGHVFWDADVFVLPALAAIHPASARAMLEYRIRRLPGACAAAKARGLNGARFPWESGADGSDVTPRWATDKHGKRIPIQTGWHEDHISADIAWAAKRYSEWTGDRSFLEGPGRTLITETARYWASRVRNDSEGRGHIYGVVGPDEYHGPVDDNAYTNVMARWNLLEGARLLSQSGDHKEAETWRAVAARLVDGWDPARGVYEQFAGYFELEPLTLSQVAPAPPVAIDVLLGTERVRGSQLIKQADVLMLHHLLPKDVVPGSLNPCLDFYEPRTSHGSSLSPAVYASLLARSGEPERALKLFRIAARLDLEDLTGTTPRGLHLAAMGGTWQALAYGFLGLYAQGGVLEIDPCLPEEWQALSLRFCFRGASVSVRSDHELVRIGCVKPLWVRVGDGEPRVCSPPGYICGIGTHEIERSDQ